MLFFVTVCVEGNYGSSCKKKCSARHCKQYSACLPTTGECDGGCQDGWTGIDCSIADAIKSGKPIYTAPVSEYVKDRTTEVLVTYNNSSNVQISLNTYCVLLTKSRFA